jgi:predicted nuclease of predicted toxin-antitoxin system
MLLLDQNISYKVKKQLTASYPGIMHVSDVGLVNAVDGQIWEYAKQHSLAIVTFDSDFLNMSLIKNLPPKIILLKTGNRKTRDIIALLLAHKPSIEMFLTEVAFEKIASLEIR